MSMRSVEAPGYAPANQTGDELQLAESISVIDKFSKFDGTFNSSRDLRVEGDVKGTINCQGTLHIAEGAHVDAKVEAENISVAGDLEGDIQCRGRLQILPSGHVKGKIATQTLVINEGASDEGQLELAGANGRLASGRSARPRGQERANPVPITQQSASAGQPEPGTTAPNTFIRRFGGQEQSWEGNHRDEQPPNEPER
jgi:cytoskeletal protein CcmA (bactofilin family)